MTLVWELLYQKGWSNDIQPVFVGLFNSQEPVGRAEGVVT